MNYGLIGVLGGAALACAIVVQQWFAAWRRTRRIERRIAGLRRQQ